MLQLRNVGIDAICKVRKITDWMSFPAVYKSSWQFFIINPSLFKTFFLLPTDSIMKWTLEIFFLADEMGWQTGRGSHSSPLHLWRAASRRDRPLWAMWTLLLWHKWLPAAVRVSTFLFATGRSSHLLSQPHYFSCSRWYQKQKKIGKLQGLSKVQSSLLIPGTSNSRIS